jgi:acyl carrier protein
MTISTRTPEGLPQRCPVCGKTAAIEPSYPGGDSCCPSCGYLLWWFRDRLSREAGSATEQITLASSLLHNLGNDSLDTVELVMELEEEFDIEIPDDAAERIKTIADAVRYIQQHRKLE